ncbi:MAG: hypothetical protein IJ565_05165 [Bacilli bacterium]|nr:hypothetical protein [Bacilli bacterium]
MNKFLKLLCSIPVILIVMYFLPFLGICLLLFRYYVYRGRKIYKAPIWMIIISLILLIPYIANYVSGIIQIKIPYIDIIMTSNIYTKLLSYSKFLFTVGIIFIIVSSIVSNIVSKLSSKINSGVKEYMRQDAEIREKNDLKIKEKQERAKTTHAVKCSKCGGDNIIYEDVGVCKFCRNPISYK